MPATIPSSRHCSRGSGRAFILRPGRSHLLRLWLLGSHALAALATLTLPLAAAGKGVLLALLAVHAYRRRQRPLGPIVCNRSGYWALPESRRTGLTLRPSTRYGNCWVDLRLADARGGVRILLIRDQLDPEAWRTMQAALRRDAQAGGRSGKWPDGGQRRRR